MSQTATRNDISEARDYLRRTINDGETVYTVLRHVNREGTARAIDVFLIHEGRPFRLTYSVAQALGYSYSRNHEAIWSRGGGQDMGYEIVHNLSRFLFGDGYRLTHSWI
jgi:hypothetical protein